MSCYRPLPAYVTAGGEVKIGYHGAALRDLELPCGRCIGCKQARLRSWSIRIMHEASMHDVNCFLTLTYADKWLPKSLSLEYEDFQKFMKRVRKSLGKVRFFCSGEYGENYRRPHWHAIFFGLDFPDRVAFLNGMFSSLICEKLWGKGNVVIGTVTAASAAYVAGYTLKKVHGAAAAEHYEDVVDLSTGELSSRRPEMLTMSRRPGIGANWYAKYAGDLFPLDHAVMDGKVSKVPRYYWERFKESADPCVVEQISHERFLRAAEFVGESTPERRAVREEVALRREAFFRKRG